MIAAFYLPFCLAGMGVACVMCMITAARKARSRHLNRCESLFAERYMRMVTMRMLDTDGVPMSRFPMIERRGARDILARALSSVAMSTCPSDAGAVRRMAVANGIESWLLRRIRHSHGFSRARYMSMLAALPVSRTTADVVHRYASARNRHVRFRAMMVRISSDPLSAMRELSLYPHRLTPFEMNELTAMLRRGMLPLAFDPLLTSESENLRMLGMNIVRIFGIAESEYRLLEIIAYDECEEFRDDAIYTLISLHLPVTREDVVERVRTMSRDARRSLYRRLASEGYSVSVLTALADGGDADYVESLAASYKRSLVCT